MFFINLGGALVGVVKTHHTFSLKMATWSQPIGFHQSCLNELARSLSQVNKAANEKVSVLRHTDLPVYISYDQEMLLLSHCPSLGQSGPVLHSRGLNAVVSLGLYALLEDKNGVCVTYNGIHSLSSYEALLD